MPFGYYQKTMAHNDWPEFRYEEWSETQDTLHMWTQIVGKIKLGLAPPINHSWHVVLYVTPVGLTTGSIPSDSGSFEISFDLINHELLIECESKKAKAFALASMAVAEFHDKIFRALSELNIAASIHETPNEVMDAIPFPQDMKHHSYDARAVERFQHALLRSDEVMKKFRSGFLGKCSPVHFFWGSFDLAVTRFSGRPAPEHPGGIPNLPDRVAKEAYSHEVSSAGFWPGGPMLPEPVYYSYAYPQPNGFENAPISPNEAYFHPELREYVLPYAAVRKAHNPEEYLLQFFQSTYEAAANLADWPRASLEKRRYSESPSS